MDPRGLTHYVCMRMRSVGVLQLAQQCQTDNYSSYTRINIQLQKIHTAHIYTNTQMCNNSVVYTPNSTRPPSLHVLSNFLLHTFSQAEFCKCCSVLISDFCQGSFNLRLCKHFTNGMENPIQIKGSRIETGAVWHNLA